MEAKRTTENTKRRPSRRSHGGHQEQSQYDHEVLDVARVVRVVKGGRRFRFRASVVVGDRSGKVGFGTGKSRDVQSAIQKAQQQAEKNIMPVVLSESTIPHESIAVYKGAHVQLRPARPGTGVIAGDVVRTVADLAGIQDLVSKVYGSANKISNVQATLRALKALRANV